MKEKRFENARICPKGDIEANWDKAIGFIPKDKEIIIYKADAAHPVARFKIGDGVTPVQDLDFAGVDMTIIEKLINKKGELLIEYVDNAIVAEALIKTENNLIEKLSDPTIFTIKPTKELTVNFTGTSFESLKKDFGEGITDSDTYVFLPGATYTVKIYEAKEINADIFYYKKSLTRTALGECLQFIKIGNSVTSIGDSAFSYCDSLTSVEIGDSVTIIGDYAFNSCGLTSVEIGDSVTGIGEGAFAYCYSLISVVIGNSVVRIGNAAFCECGVLTSVIIPESAKSIGELAFAYCGLTNITIPNSIVDIEFGAFGACSNLTSVEMGNSIATMGEFAFAYCDNLKEIIFKNPIPITYDSTWFEDTPLLTKILVPYESLEAYKTAWPEVADKIDAVAYISDIDNINKKLATATKDNILSIF